MNQVDIKVKKNRGQVLVEYLLAVILAVGIVAILTKTFRSTLFGLWTKITDEVAAGCPNGCKRSQNN